MVSFVTILILIGWAATQADEFRNQDMPWKRNVGDGSARQVTYVASSSRDGVVADVWFYDGLQGQLKEDVRLPVEYVVLLQSGELAKMTVDGQFSAEGGELNCDLYIGPDHAAFDGDDLYRQYPNVECSAVVS